MGKTAIVYYSQHHGNTKKLLDAIAGFDKDVTLIDVTEKHEVDLTGYGRIGFASGILQRRSFRGQLSFTRT